MIQTLLMQAGPPSAGPPSAAPSAPSGGGAPPSAAPTGSSTGTPTAGPAAGCGPQAASNPIVLLPFLFIVMWFIMIRPEQKRRKETETWLKSLKKGDEVVTSGGVIGRISGLTDSTVVLEVQEKVRLKVLRSSITGKAPGAAPAAVAEAEKK